MKKNVAIFISGNGSNMISLIENSTNNNYPVDIKLVISDNKNALGLKKVQEEYSNIKSVYVMYNSATEFENYCHHILKENDIDIICLAGFMRILSFNFVNKWRNKILNIHPSLLPSFKGLNAQKQALDYGVKYTGCTVHYVDEYIDNGKIIEQSVVEILDNDNIESLSKRILEQEHIIYPNALNKICNKK